MKWLFHIFVGEAPRELYAPDSLARETFVHASFREKVRESARIYFPDQAPKVMQIDPRRLDVPLRLESTPRGRMPHIYGPIPLDAVRAILTVDEVDAAPDRVTGTRFGIVAYEGMSPLDFGGALEPLARMKSMGFDAASSVEIVGATKRLWTLDGGTLDADWVRPPLDDFDVLIVPGGTGARALGRDREVVSWLETFPQNRLMVGIGSGSLLLGAAGRLMGKRATTHSAVLGLLEAYGASPVRDRVTDEGQTVTAGGVTAGLDVGFHLLARYVTDAAVQAIAEDLEYIR